MVLYSDKWESRSQSILLLLTIYIASIYIVLYIISCRFPTYCIYSTQYVLMHNIVSVSLKSYRPIKSLTSLCEVGNKKLSPLSTLLNTNWRMPCTRARNDDYNRPSLLGEWARDTLGDDAGGVVAGFLHDLMRIDYEVSGGDATFSKHGHCNFRTFFCLWKVGKSFRQNLRGDWWEY